MLATPIRGNSGPRYRHDPDESAPYKTIGVDKLTPILGAEIDGIDLSQPLADEQFDEVHRALAENSVMQSSARTTLLTIGRRGSQVASPVSRN